MEQWSFDSFCRDQIDQLLREVEAAEARDEIRKIRLTHVRTICYYAEEGLKNIFNLYLYEIF